MSNEHDSNTETQPSTAELVQKSDQESLRGDSGENETNSNDSKGYNPSNSATDIPETPEIQTEKVEEAFKIDEDSEKDIIATFSRSPAVMASENENQELAQRASQNSGLNVPNSQDLVEFALDLELPPEYEAKNSQPEGSKEQKKQAMGPSNEKKEENPIVESTCSVETVNQGKRRESLVQKRRDEQRRFGRHVNASSHYEPLLPETLDEVVIPDFEEGTLSMNANTITNPFKESSVLRRVPGSANELVLLLKTPF